LSEELIASARGAQSLGSRVERLREWRFGVGELCRNLK
jgi:hypothetical protein